MADTTAPPEVTEVTSEEKTKQGFVTAIKRRITSGINRFKSLVQKVWRGVKSVAKATAETTSKVVVKGVEVLRMAMAAIVMVIGLPFLLVAVVLLATWALTMWAAEKINPGWTRAMHLEPRGEVPAPTKATPAQQRKGRPTPKRPSGSKRQHLAPVTA